MATKIIGFDLGQREVRAWQMEVGFSKRESVARYHRSVHPLDGESLREASLRTAAALIADEGLTYESYAMPLPRSLSSVVTHRLPLGQLKQLNEVLPGELEDLLPFDEDELFYDYQITHIDEEKNELELLIAYAIREELHEYMAECKRYGVDPKSLTLGGLYTQKLVPPPAFGDLSMRVLLDIGERGSEWTVFVGDQIRHIQRCDIGGFAITQTLAEVFRVDDEMAEVGKLSEAKWLNPAALKLLHNETNGKLAMAMNDAIERALLPLKVELSRSLAFAESRYGLPIEVVYVTGGCSRLPGIHEYLQHVVLAQVKPLMPPEEMNSILPRERADGVQDYLAFAMADGLARRLYNQAINFRKNEFAYARNSGALRSITSSIVVALLMIMTLQGVRLYFEQIGALEEIAKLEAEVERLGQSILGKEGLELDTLKFKVNSAKENKVLVPEISAFDTLGELSKFISQETEVELDRLTIILSPGGRGSLEMRGKTKTVGDVSAVISAVEQSSCFSERVKKDKVSKSVDERTTFRVTASSKCK